MELNFTYQKKEWFRGYRGYQFVMKRITKLQIVVMALLPFFCAGMILLGGLDPITIVLIAVSGLLYLMIAFVMLIQPEVIYKKTNKYHQAYKLIFTKENISFETKDISSVLEWDVYSGYAETKEFFYLLQGKVTYTLIPKRVFESEERMEEFKSLLQEQL